MALFYSQPNALNLSAHAALRIKPVRHFDFARSTNSIPIAADEFVPAMFHYPIVFAGSADQSLSAPIPVAVVGLQNGHNLFISADGAWRPDTYIPGYVRRYPFALAKMPGRDDMVLAIDEKADLWSPTEGTPLYEDGQPSALAQRALQTCAAFERQSAAAQQFSLALAEAALLTDKQAEVRQSQDGPPFVFSGFRIVDEAKFNALPDATYLEWRRRGWIALVHAHLMSLRRWPGIAALASAEGDFAAARPAEAESA
jgi:hypothetical protein